MEETKAAKTGCLFCCFKKNGHVVCFVFFVLNNMFFFFCVECSLSQLVSLLETGKTCSLVLI